jgi:pimeloyl-ACP methyl ester carboxylesterase
MSITTVGGQQVHYEAFGRGQPVIFVHGWLGSWRYWWPTMQAMANQYRSFAVDLWGFGDSSKGVSDYSVASHAAMLDGFVNKMGIARPFMLVGHTLGAAVALRYANVSSKSVDRIAAIGLPLSQNYVNGYLVGKTAETVIEQSKSRFSAFPEVLMGLEKADINALEQSKGQVAQLALKDELNEVVCPLLLVFGGRDSLIKPPSSSMENGKDESLDHHIVLLEECGHFPMLDKPAVFNRLLREFLGSKVSSNLQPKDYWQRRTR